MSFAPGDELSFDVEENSIRRFFRDSSDDTASETSLLCFLYLELGFWLPYALIPKWEATKDWHDDWIEFFLSTSVYNV